MAVGQEERLHYNVMYVHNFQGEFCMVFVEHLSPINEGPG